MIELETVPNSSLLTGIRRLVSKPMLLGAVLCAVGAPSAFATHFRGATLTWKKLAAPANTVEVTITEAWRTDYPAALGQNYQWGDTTSFSTVGAPVIASGSDATGLYTIMRKVISHTYANEGPWTIQASNGNRISTLINSRDTFWTLSAVVDLRGGNQGSPVISSPIVLQMIQGGLNSMPLAYTDVDGDAVTFRMATAAESSITAVASAGGKTLSVSPSGVLTWDTSATSIGQLYAVQVVANDNHPLAPSGTGSAKVYFDFMIQIVDGTLNRPPVATGANGPFTAAIGQLFTYTVTGTDPDGGNLTVTNLGLPAGATMTPASGTSAVQPLSATLSWTPSINDAGSSVGVTFVFTDPSGLQANKSIAISMPANQPPVANAGTDFSTFDFDANHVATVVTLNGSGSYDPEGQPLTYSWTQLGGPAVTLNNSTTATPSFVAPNVTGAPVDLLFQLTVSDGKSSRSANVLVSVKNLNFAPTARASGPATADENTAVTLDGSTSSDPDNDPLTFTWTQTAGPTVILANNGTNNPLMTFTHLIAAPHSLAGETLEFTLTVSDGIASNASAPVRVFIRNVNTRPVADAGSDATYADTAVDILLDGHGHDYDGDTLSYKWTQIAGPAVTLSNPNDGETKFNAPAVSAAQGSVTLTFKITASDAIDANDTAALNASDTVDILIRHANRAPVADAGQNKNVPEGSIVFLDGTGSYDPDNDAIGSYSWVQTSGPAITLNNASTATPSFVAPDVGPAGATLTFALTVTDSPNSNFLGGPLASTPKSVTVTVQYINRPPTISAVSPVTADEGTLVTLTSSAQDPDGNPLSYLWVQLSGPSVALTGANNATAAFVAPLVPFGGGVATFQVTTSDGFGGTASAAVTVNINNVNNPPVADAGANQSVPEGANVALTGLASSDLDGEVLTYAWTQTTGPAVTIAGANTATPSFIAPLVTAGGDPAASVALVFKLTATDVAGASSSDDVEVKVVNVDHAPSANAGGSQSVGEATSVTLNASASIDPDGDPLTYSWTQISGPTVALSSVNVAKPSFTAPFVGTAGAVLKFKVVVSDPFGGSSSDTATVAVFNTNTPPDVSRATASVASLWPPNHAMVSISILGVIDPENNATIAITAVTQDEPTNGTGDGDTGPDAIIQGSTVLVRSERAGNGDGRVYHIHFTASDFEGSSRGVVTVSVPHDKKGDIAIDGGELFDSTRP